MTPPEKKNRTAKDRQPRSLDLRAKELMAAAALTIGLVVWYPGENAEQPKAPAVSPGETTVTTAPLKAEEKAPRYEITPEELELVARVVHAEAAGEGHDGQALVAQCILNTAEATGKRPDEVVLEPKQYAAPAKEASDEVKEAVTAVFLDGYEVTAEPVRYFYAPAHVESEWHETTLDFVLEHGGHRFFKE